jgi:hypothetical protein
VGTGSVQRVSFAWRLALRGGGHRVGSRHCTETGSARQVPCGDRLCAKGRHRIGDWLYAKGRPRAGRRIAIEHISAKIKTFKNMA